MAPYDDKKALEEFAKSVNVITFEFENIPVQTAKYLEKFCEIYPKPEILEVSQDRLKEKRFINQNGIKTAEYKAIDKAEDVNLAADELGFPFIIKTCTEGYDGKGQWKINNNNDLTQSIETLDFTKQYVAEGFVNFSKEISVIVTRGQDGETKCFDVAENIHENAILKQSIVPANICQQTDFNAQEIAIKIANKLDLVGVMAVEMFVCENNEIKVNELAPRPHNSGHYTLDACYISQFEQLIRAICGHQLGSTKRHSKVIMTNILGEEFYDIDKFFNQEDTKIHIYGKHGVRKNRKLAHINKLS